MSLFMQSGSHRININFTLTELELRDRDVWEISNLLTEYLETIPETGTSLKLYSYPLEIIQTGESAVKTVKYVGKAPRSPRAGKTGGRG